MIRLSDRPGPVVLWLVACYSLSRTEADAITGAAREGQPRGIPGSGGRTIIYTNGAWHVTRKDGTT
jgi:hypothetical protein